MRRATKDLRDRFRRRGAGGEFGTGRSSIPDAWAEGAGDLPPARVLDAEPRLRGLEHNAAYRLMRFKAATRRARDLRLSPGKWAAWMFAFAMLAAAAASGYPKLNWIGLGVLLGSTILPALRRGRGPDSPLLRGLTRREAIDLHLAGFPPGDAALAAWGDALAPSKVSPGGTTALFAFYVLFAVAITPPAGQHSLAILAAFFVSAGATRLFRERLRKPPPPETALLAVATEIDRALGQRMGRTTDSIEDQWKRESIRRNGTMEAVGLAAAAGLIYPLASIDWPLWLPAIAGGVVGLLPWLHPHAVPDNTDELLDACTAGIARILGDAAEESFN